jgi:hypothetical protein
MIALNCKKVNEIANIFNVSPQNLNGYMDRGTFIKLIAPEIYKRKINIDWIKTGNGNMMIDTQTSAVAESQPPYNANSTAPRISELLTKTAAVLESSTIFSSALKSNIDAFHHALHCEEQLAIAIQRIDDLEEWKKSVEKRLPSAVNGS